MSSATSIEARRSGLEADATQPSPADKTDAGFRPWHFFVLASLVARDGAVMLSRQSTPEHLILISLTIGAAGVAAAAFYRMLAPLTVRTCRLLGERPSERARAALEREKMLVLRSIKELEFDRAMGKVSPKDFDEMAGRLRARAMSLMKQLDDDGVGLPRASSSASCSSRMAGRSGSPVSASGSAEDRRERRSLRIVRHGERR